MNQASGLYFPLFIRSPAYARALASLFPVAAFFPVDCAAASARAAVVARPRVCASGTGRRSVGRIWIAPATHASSGRSGNNKIPLAGNSYIAGLGVSQRGAYRDRGGDGGVHVRRVSRGRSRARSISPRCSSRVSHRELSTAVSLSSNNSDCRRDSDALRVHGGIVFLNSSEQVRSHDLTGRCVSSFARNVNFHLSNVNVRRSADDCSFDDPLTVPFVSFNRRLG